MAGRTRWARGGVHCIAMHRSDASSSTFPVFPVFPPAPTCSNLLSLLSGQTHKPNQVSLWLRLQLQNLRGKASLARLHPLKASSCSLKSPPHPSVGAHSMWPEDPNGPRPDWHYGSLAVCHPSSSLRNVQSGIVKEVPGTSDMPPLSPQSPSRSPFTPSPPPSTTEHDPPSDC